MEQWFEEQFPGKVTVINSGGSGQNSDWGVAQVEAQVLMHRPDLVFVEFSYNDAHQRFKLSVEHCRENLDGIIAAIREQNPRTAIVLQTMNLPYDAKKTSGKSATDRPHVEAYNDNYRAVAREMGMPLVDHYQAWLRLRETDPAQFRAMIPEGSHPNKNGSLAITWPNIKALLEATRKKVTP